MKTFHEWITEVDDLLSQFYFGFDFASQDFNYDWTAAHSNGKTPAQAVADARFGEHR